MSAYGEFQTVMCEVEHLVAALKALGWSEEQIEVHQQPQALRDYHGTPRPDRAHVIIRRHHVGECSNDIGFLQGEDGRYRAIISEFDERSSGLHAGETGGYNAKWLGRLAQGYKEAQTMAVALRKGYLFRGREVEQTASGPQVRLRFTTR